MPRRPFAGFVGPSYQSTAVLADAEQSINLYGEAVESQGGTARAVLYSTPGFESFVTFPSAPFQGGTVVGTRYFAASGPNVYEVSDSGAISIFVSDSIVSTYGLAVNGTPATFANNGDAGGQLMACYGGKAVAITVDQSFPPVVINDIDVVAYLDGFFLGLDRTTSTLKVSDLLDGTTWDPTQIQQRIAGADPWVMVLVAHRDIWLFGTQTTEIWQNTGASPFPFEPIPGAFIEQGIVGPAAACVVDNAPMWLGQSKDGRGIVWRAQGASAPQRISTHAVEAALSGYDTLADAEAWTYAERGHTFFVLTFPSANATWVYDVSSGWWHERGHWNSSANRFDHYRVGGHASAFNAHLVGDRTGATLYRMASDLYTDLDGTGVRWVRRSPTVQALQNRVRYNELQIVMDVGIGLTSGQGSDPQAMLRWSNDGSKTWSNEHTTTMGAIGTYGTRVTFPRLGVGRNRVFELSGSDPVPVRITDAILDVEVWES